VRETGQQDCRAKLFNRIELFNHELVPEGVLSDGGVFGKKMLCQFLAGTRPRTTFWADQRQAHMLLEVAVFLMEVDFVWRQHLLAAMFTRCQQFVCHFLQIGTPGVHNFFPAFWAQLAS
jgi:hypothetical protein